MAWKLWWRKNILKDDLDGDNNVNQRNNIEEGASGLADSEDEQNAEDAGFVNEGDQTGTERPRFNMRLVNGFNKFADTENFDDYALS